MVDRRSEATDKNVDRRFEAIDKSMDRRFDEARDRSELQFKALLAAIAESRIQAELTTVRVVASLSEPVAMLEARHQ